jgi:hypothetical protein
MPEKNSPGQADKAAADQRTADVAADKDTTVKAEAKSAAAKVLSVDPAEAAGDPYPAYDLMTLDQLRALAKERDVEMNADVEKAHLITELRAADTHTR